MSGKSKKLQKRTVENISELIATADENEASGLKNKICKNINVLGSKDINCKDKKGKTLLNYVYELDSQNKNRLYNSNLVEIEGRIKSYGGKAVEINVEEAGLRIREPRRRDILHNSYVCFLLSLFIISCVYFSVMYIFYNVTPIDLCRRLFTNEVTTDVTNVAIQQSGINQSVTSSIKNPAVPKR